MLVQKFIKNTNYSHTPLEEICELSITHSTSSSINTLKFCKNVNYSYSFIQCWCCILETAFLPCLYFWFLPLLICKAESLLDYVLLPPSISSFIPINIHPSTKNNKKSMYYDYLMPSYFAWQRHPPVIYYEVTKVAWTVVYLIAGFFEENTRQETTTTWFQKKTCTQKPLATHMLLAKAK